MIASHYAEPLLRCLAVPTALRAAPADDADVIAELEAGDELWMLDDTRGWAWGYAGRDRRVGYLRDTTVARPGASA